MKKLRIVIILFVVAYFLSYLAIRKHFTVSAFGSKSLAATVFYESEWHQELLYNLYSPLMAVDETITDHNYYLVPDATRIFED